MKKKDLLYKEMPEADDFSELYRCLLTQAFNGRPLKLVKNPFPSEKRWLLVIEMENTTYHCDTHFGQEEIDWLCKDFDGFQKNFVNPIIISLESTAFPDRWKRFIKAAQRSAELLPMPMPPSDDGPRVLQ